MSEHLTINRHILTADEVVAKLRAIHDDVQTKWHDQWNWINADFYVECLDSLLKSQAATIAAANERLERAMDLVRFQRHELYSNRLIDDQEFAALVADSESGRRVARLESYDEVRKQLAALTSELATLRERVGPVSTEEWIRFRAFTSNPTGTMNRFEVNDLLASRANPQTKKENMNV